MSEMLRRDVLPAVIRFGRELAETIGAKERLGAGRFPCRAEAALLARVSELCDTLSEQRAELDAAIERTAAIPNLRRRAIAYREDVTEAMAGARRTSDALEDIVSKDAWPYPSYGNLLYRI